MRAAAKTATTPHRAWDAHRMNVFIFSFRSLARREKAKRQTAAAPWAGFLALGTQGSANAKPRSRPPPSLAFVPSKVATTEVSRPSYEGRPNTVAGPRRILTGFPLSPTWAPEGAALLPRDSRGRQAKEGGVRVGPKCINSALMTFLQQMTEWLGPRRLFWAMRFYPPYLGAGIRVRNIDPSLRYIEVEMPLRAGRETTFALNFVDLCIRCAIPSSCCW